MLLEDSWKVPNRDLGLAERVIDIVRSEKKGSAVPLICVVSKHVRRVELERSACNRVEKSSVAAIPSTHSSLNARKLKTAQNITS